MTTLSRRLGLAALSLGLLLVVWSGLASLYPSYVVPSVARVGERMWLLITQGELGAQFLATLLPTLTGFLLTALLATVLAFVAAEFRLVRYLVGPYALILQSIPVIALLPLLVIWFGNSALTELLIVMVIAFYPIYHNALQAFHERDPDLDALLATYHAGRLQRLWYLDLPLALPRLFVGLRVGMTLALIGTVVYELLLGHQGLGYLVGLGRARLDTALVFSALVALVGVGLLLHAVISLLQKIALAGR